MLNMKLLKISKVEESFTIYGITTIGRAIVTNRLLKESVTNRSLRCVVVQCSTFFLSKVSVDELENCIVCKQQREGGHHSKDHPAISNNKRKINYKMVPFKSITLNSMRFVKNGGLKNIVLKMTARIAYENE